ncbi:MAG TPA: AMP-binding protein [Gammaproteobacteria bacterium]|nr:AMP-binding protein [Gammaproteobacteria bacterium]
MNVDSKIACTIPELMFAGAADYAERTALEAPGESISYADLPDRVLAITRGLLASGIEKGDRISVWAPNSTDWVLVALAVHCAGGLLVPINTRMKGNEAADILERSGSRIVFVVGEFLGVDYPAMLAPLRPQTLEQVVVLGDLTGSGQTSLTDLIDAGASVTQEAARQRADSICADDSSDLLFTSGTTGKPKGVMSGHGQTLQSFREFVRILGIKPGDRYLVVNPFFHSFGYKAGWLTCMIAGATIVPQAVFDAEDIFRRVEQERITVLPGPPTLYLSMLAHPRLASADLSSLRVAVTGASAIPPVLIDRLRNELGFDVVTTAYGLTECGGLATICDPAAPAETIASTSGRAIPGTELRILDPECNEMAVGESGEICLRGFHVMQGYFNDPEATKEAITADGWLRTGDVGHVDLDGNLTITDRLKDMFIVGGFNCYPAEIEAGLFEHPAIAQVAVVGIPDERMGEVGCACVVLRSGFELTEQQLIDWSRSQMANYKVPRRVAFYPDLPKNASNKIDKLELRRGLS